MPNTDLVNWLVGGVVIAQSEWGIDPILDAHRDPVLESIIMDSIAEAGLNPRTPIPRSGIPDEIKAVGEKVVERYLEEIKERNDWITKRPSCGERTAKRAVKRPVKKHV